MPTSLTLQLLPLTQQMHEYGQLLIALVAAWREDMPTHHKFFGLLSLVFSMPEWVWVISLSATCRFLQHQSLFLLRGPEDFQLEAMALMNWVLS